MNLDKFQLDGEIVIVTGGLGLLGQEYLKAIVEIGGCAISLDKKPWASTPSTSISIRCDITREDDLEIVLDQIKAMYPNKPIYGLINNAALDPKMQKDSQDTRHLRLDSYPSDYFDKEWITCVKGAFLCTKVFGGEMLKNKRGVIINIASLLGVVAPNKQFYDELGTVKPCGYTVSKHAMIGLTRHTATEYAPHVRCNSLVLGGVYNNHSDEFVSKLSKFIPLQRMAIQGEYNPAVQFLLTEASSYMTGATLTLDGGFTAQ